MGAVIRSQRSSGSRVATVPLILPEFIGEFFGQELLYFVLIGQDMLFRGRTGPVRRAEFSVFSSQSELGKRLLGQLMLYFWPGNA